MILNFKLKQNKKVINKQGEMNISFFIKTKNKILLKIQKN